jgi:hypothetical protein
VLLCYIDESGTPEINGNTSHYVLAGIAVPVQRWKEAELDISIIKQKYGLEHDEIHTAWLLRKYIEQVITRFQICLQNYSRKTRDQGKGKQYGLLIHDNNETVAKKHTELMKTFHKKGTFWQNISNIVETPLFVNSSLTSMIQIADLCAYAIRRYLENNETDLFDYVFQRVDINNGRRVGIRHFPGSGCICKICQSHK